MISSSGVVLECESKGWYPEPELFWLDAEGKLLSAGAPETVRGPDGLYTVSSRVTVEKSHSNSFTCRVQQSKIQQTRESQIHIPGQHQLIGPPQPIVAIVGDDVILPSHLEPATDAADMPVDWMRPDLDHSLVHQRYKGQEVVTRQNPSYVGRTSLFTDKLKHGNVSLKLSEVKLSDEGGYRCLLPSLKDPGRLAGLPMSMTHDHVHLNLSSGVVLECESKGWYPEPELFWLDAEGKLLSAGAPETVRGPDGLYTVSSRVTVEKSHSNSFTCRVQQLSINQSRDTHIHVPDDLFPPNHAIAITVRVVVPVMCISAVVFILWKKESLRNQ
uniref:Ig-like domain-containing protein n=1 Tax=Myripristis murdjan TaxID=586833 RepID=A0A667YUX5_9TELE